ncbi:MAG: TatD family hydrolase, partial [Clostridia bacterium]
RQIALAREANLPFAVHEREACKDCLDILRAERVGERGGVMHCFSGSRETAKILLDMGMYISVGGPVTFKNNVKTVDMVKYVPLDRLFIETDSPYLAPVPCRGKRNDSSLVRYVAEKIAEIKGISVEEAAEATKNNAKKFFNIG